MPCPTTSPSRREPQQRCTARLACCQGAAARRAPRALAVQGVGRWAPAGPWLQARPGQQQLGSRAIFAQSLMGRLMLLACLPTPLPSLPFRPLCPRRQWANQLSDVFMPSCKDGPELSSGGKFENYFQVLQWGTAVVLPLRCSPTQPRAATPSSPQSSFVLSRPPVVQVDGFHDTLLMPQHQASPLIPTPLCPSFRFGQSAACAAACRPASQRLQLGSPERWHFTYVTECPPARAPARPLPCTPPPALTPPPLLLTRPPRSWGSLLACRRASL